MDLTRIGTTNANQPLVRVFLVFSLIVISIGLQGAFGSTASAYSSNCGSDGDPNTPHCGGSVGWRTTAWTYYGAYSQISAIRLSCIPSLCFGNGFVANQIILADDDYVVRRWVEAGYTTDTPSNNTTNEIYYWDDMRGIDDYHIWPLQAVVVPSYAYITIKYHGPPNTHGAEEYEVDINTSTHYRVTDYSTSNPMNPTSVIMGEELTGSNGADADTANWDYNEWVDSNLQAHHWTTNGTGTNISNPPYAQWDQEPSQSSTGGSWAANCC